MNGPRFLSIDLRFGRHSGHFELPSAGPVVIAGPNGSGKTTLVDALFRTVYGFRKQRPMDRELLNSRHPWAGGGCDACVHIELPDGTLVEWSRDFDSDLVTVGPAEGPVLFAGEAKPGGKGSTAEEYARLVRTVFGLNDLEDLSRTTWVAQGELRDTAFDADLLTLAEGGHASVESALLSVLEAHKELTKEPITAEGRILPKNRILENQLAELATCKSRLVASRAMELSRGPAIERLASMEPEETSLAHQIEVLDRAHGGLLELQAATAQMDLAKSQLDAVVELRDTTESATEEEAAALRELSVRVERGEYPSDFGIRASRLKEAWDQLEESDSATPVPSQPPAFALWGAGGLVGLGAALEIIGQSAGRLAILVGLVAGVGALVIASRRKSFVSTREGKREILHREIRAILKGVPDSNTITAETLPDRLESFERQESSRQRLLQARAQLADLDRRAERLASSADSPGRSLTLLEADAGRELGACESRIQDIEAAIPGQFPEGIKRIPADVKEAVGRLRLVASGLIEERRVLEVRLAGSAQIAGVEALEEECSTLEVQIEETRRSVSAHRAAHALIQEGYTDFREQDEARLIESVAARLRELGGPVFGDFRAADGLEDPTVAISSREVGIESSQLSHGQRLVVKLAVRIGTADFLAVGGVATPLVIDDPFAHLDDDNSARVWSLLSLVAETRQVIVTTQETELLGRLGIAEGVVLL